MPVILAAREGRADIVQLLMSAGANIEATDKVILMIHYCTLFDLFFGSNNNILSNRNK